MIDIKNVDMNVNVDWKDLAVALGIPEKGEWEFHYCVAVILSPVTVASETEAVLELNDDQKVRLVKYMMNHKDVTYLDDADEIRDIYEVVLEEAVHQEKNCMYSQLMSDELGVCNIEFPVMIRDIINK